jgi:hypothetical protein
LGVDLQGRQRPPALGLGVEEQAPVIDRTQSDRCDPIGDTDKVPLDPVGADHTIRGSGLLLETVDRHGSSSTRKIPRSPDAFESSAAHRDA